MLLSVPWPLKIVRSVASSPSAKCDQYLSHAAKIQNEFREGGTLQQLMAILIGQNNRGKVQDEQRNSTLSCNIIAAIVALSVKNRKTFPSSNNRASSFPLVATNKKTFKDQNVEEKMAALQKTTNKNLRDQISVALKEFKK